MTIQDPVIVINETLSFTLSGVSNAVNSFYLFRKNQISGFVGTDPTLIAGYENLYLPLTVLTQTTVEFKFNDIQYVAGDMVLFLNDDVGWTKKDFKLSDVSKSTGLNFPVTIETASEKQPTPIADSKDIKGAPKYFDNFNDFLYLPKQHMQVNMIVTLFDNESNTIKQLVLNRNGVELGNGLFSPIIESDIAGLPTPMIKSDISIARSYLRYWTLLSESVEVKPLLGSIKYYAPDLNDGIPPLYDNVLSGAGITFPAGLGFPAGASFDENREFCGVWTYDSPTAQFTNTDAGTTIHFPTRQVTKERKANDKWFIESVDGVSFTRWRRIGAFDADSVTQNRYIRRVTHINDPNGTLINSDPKSAIKPLTYVNEVRNRYGSYVDTFNTATSTILNYEDVPPAKRINYAGLSTEEKAFYDSLLADGIVVGEIDLDGIWEVTCIKDKYNRLESEYSIARYIPNNGDLVRYSTNSTPDINDILEVDWVANGWISEFSPESHIYKAERANTGVNFTITQISAEIGSYTEILFKAYPNNYFDELTNTSTRNNYIPTGLSGGINVNDDIDGTFTWDNGNSTISAPNKGAWVDTPFIAPSGWKLWSSQAVLFFGGDAIKTPWSVPKLHDTTSTVIDIIEGQEDFKSTTVTDNDGLETTTHDPLTIILKAGLFEFTSKVEDEGQQYLLNDDPNETINYKWELIFNDGAIASDIIFDNTTTANASEFLNETFLDGAGNATYSPTAIDTYGVSSFGRFLVVYPQGILKRAVFKVTQERILPTGTILYTEETRGLFDIADGISPKGVVVTSDKPFFNLKGNISLTEGKFLYTDYINPNGANHPEIILRAFLQNVDGSAGNWYRWDSGELFDDVRGNVFSGTTKEATTSVAYWEQKSTAEEYSLEADNTEWDTGNYEQTEIYKYQSGAFYDILRISRIQAGNDARLIKLISSSQLISFDGGETAFSPDPQLLEFTAQLENILTENVIWTIEDSAGGSLSSTVFLYDAPIAGTLITQGVATAIKTAYIRTGDYPIGAAFDAIRDALHFKIKIAADGYTDLIDYSTIYKNATAGPEGADSIAVFLDNEADLTSVNSLGLPIDSAFNLINGTLTIESNIVVFLGLLDVSGSYEIDGGVDLTAADQSGAIKTKGTGSSNFNYTLASGKITVTRIPEDSDKLIINVPIKSTGGSVIATKKLTIGKAYSGFNNLNVSLDNEFQLVTVDTTGTVIGGTDSGLTGFVVVAIITPTILDGITPISVVFNGDTADTIVALDGADSPLAFNTLSTAFSNLGETTTRFRQHTSSGNVYYVVQGDSGKIYFISKEDETGVNFRYNLGFQKDNQLIKKSFNISYNVQNDFYQVILESTNTSFHGTDAPTSFVEIDAYVINIEGVKQDPLPVDLNLVWNVGTTQPPTAGYIGKVKILKSEISVSKVVTANLKRGSSFLGQGVITVYDLQDSAASQRLYYQTSLATTPSKPVNLDVATYPSGSNNVWGQTEDNSFIYLWESRKNEFDQSWGWAIQVRGEKGEQGDLIYPVTVYRISDHIPVISGGSLPIGNDLSSWAEPNGWSKSPLLADEKKSWVAIRAIRAIKDNTGNYSYSWGDLWKVSMIGGSDTRKRVSIYRSSSTETPTWQNSRDEGGDMQLDYPQVGGLWKSDLAEITDAPDFIFKADGTTVNGVLYKLEVDVTHKEVQLSASDNNTISYSGSTLYIFLDENGQEITTGVVTDSYIYNSELYIKSYVGGTPGHAWTKNNSLLYYWTKPALIFKKGSVGLTGDDGFTPVPSWSGTSLGFTEAGGGVSTRVNLKGDKGDDGIFNQSSYWDDTKKITLSRTTDPEYRIVFRKSNIGIVHVYGRTHTTSGTDANWNLIIPNLASNGMKPDNFGITVNRYVIEGFGQGHVNVNQSQGTERHIAPFIYSSGHNYYINFWTGPTGWTTTFQFTYAHSGGGFF